MHELLFQPFCLFVMAHLLANNIWYQNFAAEFFQLRPSLPRYAFTWDTGKLLSNYRQMQENSELTLKQLTLKLATILALLMSQRAQTIHSLDINYMKKESDIIILASPTILKPSRPGHYLKLFLLKSIMLKIVSS